jgi:hypothetical protein
VRRAVVPWLLAALAVIAAGTGVVLLLNATAFSAASFVRVYLDAVARGDATGALAMPGVTADADLRLDLLTDGTQLGLADLREVSVEPSAESGEDGILNVAFSWVSPEGAGQTTFAVQQIGTRFGIFPEWGFAESPVAELSLTVEHDERFEVNGVSTTSEVAASEAVGYAVLVPGVYRVDHHSTYLRADAVTVTADQPGSRLDATLDVQPAAAFVEKLSAEVRMLLGTCATQDVLFPTACPLGQPVNDRTVSVPEWSIVEYPEITIEPGAEFGTWVVPGSPFTAHLVVDIQSLFDGTVRTFDEDLPFVARYLVTILADDETLRIVPLLDD